MNFSFCILSQLFVKLFWMTALFIFYASNSVLNFAVAFIQTENFKDIDGPFCLHLKEVQCILLMLKNRLNFDRKSTSSNL